MYNIIKHFYQDPFSDEDLIPKNKIACLTYNEAVAEKLKAAISRRNIAIRDYYDLWHIELAGFNFKNDKFIKIFKRKVSEEGYKGNFMVNFGLKEDDITKLYNQVNTELMPVIRDGENFNLEKLFAKFNQIFLNEKFTLLEE
ncbi:nucleotidyl transferase AbiEii/AbiGii toxin family protein [bacterium]